MHNPRPSDRRPRISTARSLPTLRFVAAFDAVKVTQYTTQRPVDLEAAITPPLCPQRERLVPAPMDVRVALWRPWRWEFSAVRGNRFRPSGQKRLDS
jgi:hypothetical protein